MSTFQDEITRFWDTRPESYDQAVFHGLRNEREKAVWLSTLRALVADAPRDVLDAGTGTGFLALLLAESGHRVTGIDLSEGMLAVADLAALLSALIAIPLGALAQPRGALRRAVCGTGASRYQRRPRRRYA
jgi:2-polyprenyl-3-methyl-5-hydroxy-6-metoxy-1,4-benzoquinol methylase